MPIAIAIATFSLIIQTMCAAQESLIEESPLNQTITPAGDRIDLPNMRPQVLGLTPNGRWLLTSGKTNKLVVIDAETQKVSQSVEFPSNDQVSEPTSVSDNILKPDPAALVSYTGLVCSSDGKSVYVSNVSGNIKVFSVDEQGAISASHTIPLPSANAPRRKQEIPSGLAIDETNQTLWVCGNLSNSLLEVDLKQKKVVRQFAVGVAPYDVVIHGSKAYVSNWGGRRPADGDLTGPAGRGTTVRVDPIRHIANDGSVSIVDLKSSTATEVLVGLSPTDLALSPDGKYVVCANTNSDHLSVIETATDRVVETIWVNSSPADLYGAAPNSLAFDNTGRTLFVGNGSQNAIAVVHFEPEEKGDSKLKGLIPVGWYPGALSFDPSRNRICSANLKGLPKTPKKSGSGEGFNTHQHYGSISVVPIPDEASLAVLSEQVAKNMRREAIQQAAQPARPNQAAKAIPERIGEPSLIEHVVYIIKENRTYDQVLGDLAQGNGNTDLCIFGRSITPNQHQLAEQFVLLDNTYCCGILSADGHQWSTSAMSNGYLEKSFAGFPRSYPDGMGEDDVDALAYSPAGFLWDNAILHQKTLRNYGEFMIPKFRWSDASKKGTPDYMSCYRTWKGSGEVIFESEPAIESLRPYSPTGYVGWGMEVPDQVRADFFLNELSAFEKQGSFPNLTIICLPNDHTSGTAPRFPSPASSMADNDLALGRIVEGLSKSKFWPKMAIFAIEDDPQAGWDHVSGYRTIAFCASPFSKRGQKVSTRYNTNSMIRTMEQILGLPPMNQFDAAATPMFDCFVDTPNLTPFVAAPVDTPLDQLNTPLAQIVDPARRQFAEASAKIDFTAVDRAPEDLLNRILWNSLRGDDAYPEWAITITDDEDEE